MTVLTNARVVQGDQVVDGGWIRCEGERFAEVGRGHLPFDQHLSVGGRLVVPGFVEIHVHGGGGGGFTTGSAEEGAEVAYFHRRHGTTTLLASLVTAPLSNLLRQISVLAELVDDEIVAGLHLEGPFLSSVRCGAQAPSLLRVPTRGDVEQLRCRRPGAVRMATLAPELISIEGPTRRSIAVVDSSNGEATLFNEAGPRVPAARWEDLEAMLAARLPEATALVVSGSLPPGANDDAYAQLVRLAASHRVTVLVDTVGEALLQAAAAGADILKPNERASRHHGPLRRRSCRHRTQTARCEGRRGIAWRSRDDRIHLGRILAGRPPTRIVGNPTGSGDAAAAALIAGAVAGAPWPDRLRDAVALSAAAVIQPTAGTFDMNHHRRFVPQTFVEERHAPGLDR